MTLHLLFFCWNNMHEIDRRFLSRNFPSAKFRSCTSLHFVYKFNNIFLFKCDLRCLCNVQCPIQVKNWTTNSQDVDQRSKCFCCTQTQHVGLPNASVGDVKPNMLGHRTQRVNTDDNLHITHFTYVIGDTHTHLIHAVTISTSHTLLYIHVYKSDIK